MAPLAGAMPLADAIVLAGAMPLAQNLDVFPFICPLALFNPLDILFPLEHCVNHNYGNFPIPFFVITYDLPDCP